MSRVDLRGAILHNANLVEADLIEADLSGADLSGADLSGALEERFDPEVSVMTGARISIQTAIRLAEARGLIVQDSLGEET